MTARSIPIVPEVFYHIYNRGNNRERVFPHRQTYSFFLARLNKYFSKSGVDLLAYCLMPNHFHLLVVFDGQVDFPNVMRSFSTSYVKSFNRFYNRTGHLFEGDYQAKAIEKEDYLTNVIRYIHLNPLFAGLVSKPEYWEHSDYRTWIIDGGPARTPSLRLRDELFGGGASYRDFVEDFAEAKVEQKKLERLLGLSSP